MLASVARRTSTPLVSAWRGFDSRRRLRVDAALRCPSPRRATAGASAQCGHPRGEGPVFQTVPSEFDSRCPLPPCRYGSKVEHRSASPTARVRFPLPAPTARCSGSNTVCKIVERGSTPRRASECFRPRPGPASSKRRAARSTRAGSARSHSSSGPGRWTLNPATRVRFPHATPHLHPRWAAGLRSQLGRFDSSWRYKCASAAAASRSGASVHRFRTRFLGAVERPDQTI